MLLLPRLCGRSARLRLILGLASLLFGGLRVPLASAALPAPPALGGPLLVLASANPAATEAAEALADALNADREQHGVPALELSDALSASAAVRAAELDGQVPLSHDRPDGSLFALLANEGVDCTLAGEALARVPAATPGAAVAAAHHLLLSSDAHRNMLLSPRFAYIGVAVTRSRGQWLFVQLLTD